MKYDLDGSGGTVASHAERLRGVLEGEAVGDQCLRDLGLLYGSRDAAAFPLLVQHADVLAEVGSDDEFEVGLNALLAGFRTLIDNTTVNRASRRQDAI